jgi:hypothetical protein
MSVLHALERQLSDIDTHIQAFGATDQSLGMRRQLADAIRREKHIRAVRPLYVTEGVADAVSMAPGSVVWVQSPGEGGGLWNEQLSVAQEKAFQDAIVYGQGAYRAGGGGGQGARAEAEPLPPPSATASLHYTFGADAEMDEAWIKSQRAAPPLLTPPCEEADLDRYMFPTLAFAPTGLANLRFGTGS